MAKKKSKARQPRSGKSKAARDTAKDAASSDVIATLPADPRRQVYELEVTLVDGWKKKFVKRKPIVSRTIELRGHQTLDDLHEAIYEAFDRWDEHLYEFRFNGEGPSDPKARRYVLPIMLEDEMWMTEAMDGDLTETTIASLGLQVGDVFAYEFDYGDCWWHTVTVRTIDAREADGDYPRITQRTGESPPQYLDEDDDD